MNLDLDLDLDSGFDGDFEGDFEGFVLEEEGRSETLRLGAVLWRMVGLGRVRRKRV